MLYNFLIVILVLDALVLIGAILLQSGKGSGLAASFGGASSSPDAFIGIHQAGTILTKATWWCGGFFLALSFLLQILSTRTSAPKSVLEGTFNSPPPATAPATPNTTAPAVPLQSAPGAGTAPATSAPTTTIPGLTPAPAPVTPPATKK
jgi:preprotein translocase subunit SecG